MKTFAIYILCAAIVCLPACDVLGMTPQQRESARISLGNEFDAGRLTKDQYEAAIEALDKPTITADDWANWLMAGGSVIASILLGVPIAVGRVQKVRGAPRTQAQTAVLQQLAKRTDATGS